MAFYKPASQLAPAPTERAVGPKSPKSPKSSVQRPLHILYHHRTGSQDGQAVHITAMIDAFEEAGHKVTVIAPSLRPANFGQSSALLAKARQLLPKALLEIAELLYALRDFAKLFRAYRRLKPDLLYERSNLYLPSGLLLKRLTGIAFYLEINAFLAQERHTHGGLFWYKAAKAIEKACWRGADLCLPVSEILAQKLRANKIEPHKIMVCHNGVKLADYPLSPAPKNDAKSITLGFTGFVRDWHRLDLVLDYIAKAKEAEKTNPHLQKARLILKIAGEGPALSALKEQATRLDLHDRIEWLGLVERRDIPALLARFDIALQPAATAYASPLKLFEYMAAGLAILAPNSPNITEILTDNKSALLFTDPPSFCAALDRLCADKALRQRLGAEARASISEKGFTWQHNAARICQHYYETIAKK